jgi:uncharacterized protein (DUF983 family)
MPESDEHPRRLLASELAYLQRKNNPHNEPTGHFTGRCSRCGSKDLWDDNLAYGCNACGAILGTN